MADEQPVQSIKVRYLACLDEQPPSAGQCQNMAWVEQTTWVHYLPTTEQAVGVGGAFFVSLFTLAAAKSLLKPPKYVN